MALIVVAALWAPGVASAAAPTNDAFAGATVVGSLPFAVSEDTTEATGSAEDPLFLSQCDSTNAKSVWFSYTPASDQRVAVDVSGSSYSPMVRVVTGTPGAFTLVACSPFAPTSALRFDAAAHTTYHVEVNDPSGAGGTLATSLSVAPAGPANDSYANATSISGYDFTDTVNTTTAIQAPDDPLVCSNWNGYATIWYRWVAPADATATVTTAGSDYTSALEVATGHPGAFTPVGCGYHSYGQQPRVAFAAHAGTTYSIMVGSTYPDFGGGNAVLTLAARRPSGLTFTRSSSLVAYGHAVTLTAHLAGWHTNSTVSIYATPWGGTRKLLVAGSVGPAGNLRVVTTPARNTTYSAIYTGDDWYKGATVGVMVRVRVIVIGRLSGYYATSGHYRLYHYRTQCPRYHTYCPVYTASVKPNHAGRRVSFILQVYARGAWRTALSFSGTLGHLSTLRVRLVYTGTAVEGVPTRIRTTFTADHDHAGSTSPWSYFKVTA